MRSLSWQSLPFASALAAFLAALALHASCGHESETNALSDQNLGSDAEAQAGAETQESSRAPLDDASSPDAPRAEPDTRNLGIDEAEPTPPRPDAATEVGQADPLDTPLEPDAPTEEVADAGADSAADTESGPMQDAAPLPDCDEAPKQPFSYACKIADPTTCPDGICLFGICLGPILDPNRWADCGDGHCDVCAEAAACPADCGPTPVVQPAPLHSPDAISVWVHGFRNVNDAAFKAMTYGSIDGCGGVFTKIAEFGVQRPCAEHPTLGTAPNHFMKVEYFGAKAPPWMAPLDVAEVEQYDWSGTDALHRYALIVAKTIRWRLDISGAKAANLACHSMGCLITRHMIEHNLENLAAEGRLARWVTSAGVISGARLARLYDNPSVQQIADALGLGVNEFAFMNPDFVMDWTAAWDHRNYEGNSPYFRHIPIHHHTASNPKIASALGIQLLDLDNPGDEPNDGIMYTLDQHFHAQNATGAFHPPGGEPLAASHTTFYIDHENLPDTDSFVLLAAAGLFHQRRVRITLKEVLLYKDFESQFPFDGQAGTPPAELMTEVRVRYNPYVQQTFGKNVLVHQTSREHRTSVIFPATQGKSAAPDLILFEGPLFDEMQALHLELDLMEADWYPRFGIFEWAFPPAAKVLGHAGSLALTAGEVVLENNNARLVLNVQVQPLFAP